MSKGEGSGPDLTNILLIGGVAYGAYWYLTNFGPNGQVSVAGGVSYWQQWFGGAAAPTAPGATATAAQPAATNPRVTFQTSGGNNTRTVGGESWQVNVTGALPNAQVSVKSTKAGSAPFDWLPGSTDANGNFQTSGVTDSANAGNWQEVWSVGGQQIAILSFTVVPGAPGVGEIKTEKVTDLAQGQRSSMSFHGAPMSGHGFGKGKRPMGQKSAGVTIQ